jgi:hypothetical protein
MSAEIKEEQREHQRQGLKDGGHIIIRCSNCNKPLADIWRTRPNMKDPRTSKLFEWKFVAECCYCKDKSYITTVSGGVHIGGYGVTTYENKEVLDTSEKTTITETIPMPGREDVTLIKTARCN